MKYLIIKNKKLYKLFFKFELRRFCYKSLFFNRQLPLYLRQRAYDNLSNSTKCYSLTKRCCYSTTNTRSISNHFKTSRMKLRLLFSNNYVNGIKKY